MDYEVFYSAVATGTIIPGPVWIRGVVLAHSFWWFFRQPWVASQYAWTCVETPRPPLPSCPECALSIALPSLYSAPWAPWNSSSVPQLWETWALPGPSLPVLKPVDSQSNSRAHLIFFPSLRDHCPLFPGILSWTSLFHVLVTFCGCFRQEGKDSPYQSILTRIKVIYPFLIS